MNPLAGGDIGVIIGCHPQAGGSLRIDHALRVQFLVMGTHFEDLLYLKLVLGPCFLTLLAD